MTYRPMMSALEMFRAGFDTAWIAKYFRIDEAEAEKRLTLDRSAALGLPSPYQSSLNAPPAFNALRGHSSSQLRRAL